MIIFKDIVSGMEVASDAFEIKQATRAKYDKDLGDFTKKGGKYNDVILALESMKVTVGGDIEVDIGANASVEGGGDEEKLEASERKQVLNVVESQHLQKVDIDKPSEKLLNSLKSDKEDELIKAFSGSSWANANLNKFWVALKNALQEKKLKYLLKVDPTYKVNKDRSKVKDEETKLVLKLKNDEKAEFEMARAKYEKFEKDYKKINLFYAQYVLPNFNEFEFYIPDEGSVGESLLIPARYIGEATTPFFYYITAALLEEKQ